MMGLLGSLALLAAGPALAQPANDDCANATVVAALPFTEVVDLTGATAEPGGEPAGSCSFPAGMSQSVWYQWTNSTGADVRVSFDVFDPADPTLDDFAAAEFFTGACGALVEIGDCGEGEERGAAIVAAGQTVRMRVASGPFETGVRVTIQESDEIVIGDEKFDVQFVAPNVAMNGAGRFMAAWDAGNISDIRVRGRVYDADGAPLTGVIEFSADGEAPEVAAATTGDFLIVWEESSDIHAQRVGDDGALIGGSFIVNSYTTSVQGEPAIAPAPGGGFVVAWEGVGPGGGGIVARRIDSSGAGIGGDFQVNESTSGWFYDARVATDATGAFVVAWTAGYAARMFDPTGTPLGGEFEPGDSLDNKYGGFSSVDVARMPSGEFMVVWQGYRDEPGFEECNIQGQSFAPDGTPATSTFCVHEIGPYGEYNHHRLAASANADGFVVVWENDGGRTEYDPRDQIDPAARLFGADGTPLGGDIHVTLLNQGQQYVPDVSAGPSGGFVGVWNDDSGANAHGLNQAVVARVFPADRRCSVAPLAGCLEPVQAFKAKLLLDDKTPADGDESLGWKWIKGAETTVADLGDPLAADGYSLCMYDESGGGSQLVFAADAPAGGTCGTKPCWKTTKVGAVKYVDKERTPDGLKKLIAKPGVAGKAKIVVKGGGADLGGTLGIPSLPLALPLRVQLQTMHGPCWEATYYPVGASKNDGSRFIGKAGSPSGAFLGDAGR